MYIVALLFSIHQSIIRSIDWSCISYLSIHHSICLSINLLLTHPIYLSIHPYIYLSIHISIYLPIHPYIYLPIHQSMHLSIHLISISNYPSSHLYIPTTTNKILASFFYSYIIFIHLYTLFIYLSINHYGISIYPFIYLFIYIVMVGYRLWEVTGN